MAKSFAQYASQFLTHQSNLESSLSSSQPLFFSFTTDEGSRIGNNHDSDLDDLDDPHLRASYVSRTSRRDGHDDYRSRVDEGDDDDPYLRLDEDDLQPGASRYASQSIPLISSEYSHTGSPEYPKGWLAHQASPLPRSRSPSPAPSSSSLDSHRLATDVFKPTNNKAVHPQTSPPLPPPPLAREPISLSLTESLLPRDGTSRPVDVFSLPDPRYVPRGRRRYNDSVWIVLWCTGVSLCVIFSVLLLFLTQKPTKSPVNFPYTTLLHTVPMITIITFLSAVAAYTHIFLLRIFVRPVMIATSVFIPATLFISAIWAFVGSFMWEAGQEPTWGETVGLRLFSLVPLILSIITARRLIDLPRDIHTTSSILDLTTRLLLSNPFLLALSPAILLITLVASIPFLTLVFRLLLIGYTLHPTGGGLEWHVRGWAHWAIFGAISIWLWSWGVARGTLRTTCAGVIGAWYFADLDLPPPLPSDTRTIHAALTRSTQPSLGSIILAALILTGIRLLALLTIALRLLPSYLPLVLRPWLQPLTLGAGFAVGWLEGVTSSLSKYALVYTGLTGDPFFPSARRARALTAAVESRSAGSYRRKFKTEPPLTMLTYSPLTLTFPFALMTYLFVAHTLSAPDQALGAALLAGGVTALVGLFCVGLVKDTADTLYVCYCIDKDLGNKRRDEVFSAFEYDLRPQNPSRPQPTRPVQPSPSTPPKQQYRQQTPQHLSPQPNMPLIQTSPTPLPPRSARPQPPIQLAPPSAQAIVPESDIDPFEQEPIDFPISMPGPALQQTVGASSKRDVAPYSVSPEPRRRDEYSDDDDDDDEGNESQIFPGSGLF